MSGELWVAVLVTALGTLAMRMLPLLWMRKRLRQQANSDVDALPQWLGILGPLMIAAVLGVSLIPQQPDTTSWSATLLGCIVTFGVWYRSRSLGWPVAAGVATFGMVIVVGSML
uniref:AzlD domain-containing protein n=1 Tax=Halomonas sp. TaxID=1486246 RepID=UPI002633D3DA|nr:AzlD domain-containing protein [Halomonas sp.]